MEDKAICLKCNEYVDYYFTETPKTVKYRGKGISFLERRAWCKVCGEEIDVPGLWDENLRRVQENYLIEVIEERDKLFNKNDGEK